VHSSLTFYRVMAWIVGVLLIVLVLVAVPIKYLGHNDTMVAIVGPAHGFLYMLYLIAVLNLALRSSWMHDGWGWIRTLLVALAGTIPFLSFVAEHLVTKNVKAELAHPAVAGG
jgi:integral membrane protein